MSPSDREHEVVAALVDAVRSSEAVPRSWVEAAKAAWTWRTVDAELAELAFESFGSPVGARSTAGTTAGVDEVTTLGFRCVDLVVVVEAQGRAMRVLLTPDVGGSVVVECADGTVVSASPAGPGSFTADGVPPGPVRLRVHRGHRTVLTSWFRLGLSDQAAP